jgi:hypothetical protein
MVKDPDEIYAISQAAHLCDIGQAAVLKVSMRRNTSFFNSRG